MPAWIDATFVLHAGCAVLYGVLAALILVRGRRGPTAVLLAAGCIATGLWAAAVAAISLVPAAPVAFALDLLRPAVWLAFILHLYRRAALGGRQSGQILLMLGLLAVLVAGAALLFGRTGGGGISLRIVWVMSLMGLAIGTVLVIENLWLSTPDDLRWHITLPCIALGALAVYDVVLAGDTLLFRVISPVLFNGRALAAGFVAPLLAIAAARNKRNWNVDLYVSRSVVFHSATLMIAGVFMLGLVGAGQAFRWIGADWGGVAEISLLFAGLVTLAVLITSRSARARLRFLVIDHLFTHRYDYRAEWMRSSATLSATEGYVALHARAIRAVAEIVDSQGGILYVRDAGGASFEWAGSRNMPAGTPPVPLDHPLVAAMRGGEWTVELAGLAAEAPEAAGLPAAWLAVPLNHGGQVIGFVLLADPRGPFRLDREVFDLLRVVGRQVATVVAEQRAAEVLLQTRQLHDYGKRFAFVAHDIKNVSTQLSLLLQNAEVHLENPEFQRDMLGTIRAAVGKIGSLIKRLETPDHEVAQAVVMPSERLEPILANARRARGAAIETETIGPEAGIAMAAPAFDAVVTHVLNNALEASRGMSDPPPPVRVVVRHQGRRATIDIIDEGPGMTPEFVRDDLFRPFRTSKPGGSGIGAYQARELLREAGGDLVVISQPGAGTTMRLLLPAVEGAAVPSPGAAVPSPGAAVPSPGAALPSPGAPSGAIERQAAEPR
jgi:putative PEP-CTERM system histidine kinase